MRRFWKAPQAMLDEFERLIRDTDLPATECASRAGLSKNSNTNTPIVAKYRRYIGNGRWADRATGKVRPEICTKACAAEKIGASIRTITRRITAGIVEPVASQSYGRLSTFTEEEIEKLRTFGINPGDNKGVLTRDDVIQIRELAASGIPHTRIAESFPVTRRQISRIVRKERWSKVC